MRADAPPLLALTYSDGAAADAVVRAAASDLRQNGRRLAGLVQHNLPRPHRARCDMVLEELASGELVAISEDRGPLAKGCILNVDGLLRAMQLVRAAMAAQPDLLILNKFGKSEAEGGGLRSLIAEAIDATIPVLVAVPYRNLDNWRAFVGDLSCEVALQSHTESLATIFTQLGRPKAHRPGLAEVSDSDRPNPKDFSCHPADVLQGRKAPSSRVVSTSVPPFDT